MKPQIKTSLPGPRAKEILKKDKKFISPSYTRVYPAVIERGKGVWVWDVDGNKFLDMNAGIAVCATGHSHPEIFKAIKEQSKKLLHYSGTDFYYPQQTLLAEKLAEIVPGGKNRKVFFTNSGAESIEAAMKVSRHHTKRPYFIAYYGAFHGRSMGALSLTASKTVQRKGFYSLVPGVVHIPYPYCYRCPFKETYSTCGFACIMFIEDYVFSKLVPPEEVAAIVFEPIQGEGGYVPAPPNYFEELKKLAKKYDILLVDDEIQAGMGRTGKFFAIEHWNCIPDIVTIAKGIASGLPLGACVTRSSIMDWPPGSHASTFGGNPVSCIASLKTIELLERELIDNAKILGDYILKELSKFKEEFEFIGDIRGKGLMIGIEFVKDKNTKEKNPELRARVVLECFKKGMLILGAGTNTIRLIPPLTLKKNEADTALTILREIFKEI